jgi:transposase
VSAATWRTKSAACSRRSACCSRAIGGQFRGHVLRLIDEQHPLRPVIDGLLTGHERAEEQQAVLDTRVRKEAKADETTRG